jgi:hypothetical protein
MREKHRGIVFVLASASQDAIVRFGCVDDAVALSSLNGNYSTSNFEKYSIVYSVQVPDSNGLLHVIQQTLKGFRTRFNDEIFYLSSDLAVKIVKLFEQSNRRHKLKRDIVDYIDTADPILADYLAATGIVSKCDLRQLRRDFSHAYEARKEPQDNSTYMINDLDGPFNKTELAHRVVEYYVAHAEDPDTVYESLGLLGIKAPHFIETEEEYTSRVKRSNLKRTRARPVACGSETLYVTEQWTLATISDFIDCVNAMNCGIKISRVENDVIA